MLFPDNRFEAIFELRRTKSQFIKARKLLQTTHCFCRAEGFVAAHKIPNWWWNLAVLFWVFVNYVRVKSQRIHWKYKPCSSQFRFRRTFLLTQIHRNFIFCHFFVFKWKTMKHDLTWLTCKQASEKKRSHFFRQVCVIFFPYYIWVRSGFLVFAFTCT